MEAPKIGTLYLVATPIGNPDDITFRALKVLKEADLIVCEELKEGRKILSTYQIEPKEIDTLNEHNESLKVEKIINDLKSGKNVALISDAGTPVFSDPGSLLVKQAIKEGIKIVPVPGASALLLALIVSGFNIEKFVYYGWLSQKRQRRREELRRLKGEQRTVVIFETPYRIIPVLEDIGAVLGVDRKICVAFNLTMPDEEIVRGNVIEVVNYFVGKKKKGECVIVIAGAEESKRIEF
ncbi:16S rRNA (cytidine1402-2'-O)-methyltransferase [Candidatus Thermokryptus mobilis]|uniref:Ribosomal RNA small subunit methyltransferase I n=1 Tax=Candidatus Thermokryptus mobilis TaxID=1643428 RepID=A0A0S4N8F9_9BACT|nr:16S rRNA (cytidine(1402)-2'-O)-methyltransferase [Candidatus Thermokryptus mobilis]CUU07112.1 16S rRNA (cytidine1402-2'-O)-methyltransferase [Candidatus Thermokryptus mobilis]